MTFLVNRRKNNKYEFKARETHTRFRSTDRSREIIVLAKRSLQCIAIAHIVLGCVLPLLGSSVVMQRWLPSAMLPNTIIPDVLREPITFLITLFGPTVASWGLLFLIAINLYFQTPTRQLWWSLIAALFVWYLGDSSYSLWHGASTAFILNSVVMLAIFIPLFIARPSALASRHSLN